MLFGSPITGFQVLVRPEHEQWHPTMNVIVGTTPRITADFAVHGAEVSYLDENGNTQISSDIRGGVFDTLAAQQQHGWTDEERGIVETTLLKLCETQPEYIHLREAVAAVRPWPTYDDVHHKQIPALAEQLGLVGEALAYETENKNRTEVVEKLTELLSQNTVAEELTAA